MRRAILGYRNIGSNINNVKKIPVITLAYGYIRVKTSVITRTMEEQPDYRNIKYNVGERVFDKWTHQVTPELPTYISFMLHLNFF